MINRSIAAVFFCLIFAACGAGGNSSTVPTSNHATPLPTPSPSATPDNTTGSGACSEFTDAEMVAMVGGDRLKHEETIGADFTSCAWSPVSTLAPTPDLSVYITLIEGGPKTNYPVTGKGVTQVADLKRPAGYTLDATGLPMLNVQLGDTGFSVNVAYVGADSGKSPEHAIAVALLTKHS